MVSPCPAAQRSARTHGRPREVSRSNPATAAAAAAAEQQDVVPHGSVRLMPTSIGTVGPQSERRRTVPCTGAYQAALRAGAVPVGAVRIDATWHLGSATSGAGGRIASLPQGLAPASPPPSVRPPPVASMDSGAMQTRGPAGVLSFGRKRVVCPEQLRDIITCAHVLTARHGTTTLRKQAHNPSRRRSCPSAQTVHKQG